MAEPRWRVAIADDEPAARLGVRQLLRPHADFEVQAECRHGREVVEVLTHGQIDALFLDIQMPELDGFEVLQACRKQPQAELPAFIFLTAYDHYAVAAFEVQALDYLVKPVSERRFATTLDRLRQHLAARAAAKSPVAPQDPPLPHHLPTTLLTTLGREKLLLPIADIEWIESADNYAKVWVGGRGYLVRQPLNELEKQLRHQGFLRAHRQALLRLSAVRRLLSGKDGELVAQLTSGARIPIARRRRAAFAAALHP